MVGEEHKAWLCQRRLPAGDVLSGGIEPTPKQRSLAALGRRGHDAAGRLQRSDAPVAFALPRIERQVDMGMTARQHAVPVDRQAGGPQPGNHGHRCGMFGFVACRACERHHVGRLRLGVLLHRTGQHRMWPELDETAGAITQQLLHDGIELHRRAQVATPMRRIELAAVRRAPERGREDRHGRCVRREPSQFGRQRCRGCIHLRAVRRHIHVDPPAEEALGLRTSAMAPSAHWIARDTQDAACCSRPPPSDARGRRAAVGIRASAADQRHPALAAGAPSARCGGR